MLCENRIAIMQPYFLPYLGYWQLLSCVDTFVVYDDVEFTKRGWIHRNRYLSNGSDQMFSLPLKKDSDDLDVRDRYLADSWDLEKIKLKRKIEGAYRKAPYFNEGMSILMDCLNFEERNLFDFIYNSIDKIRNALGISTRLVVSSQVGDTRHLKSQDRVVDICERLSATEYINPIGGQDLYRSECFRERGIDLTFHQIGNVRYKQNSNHFVSHLSVLDVLMFIGLDGAKNELNNFEFKK